MLIFPAVIKDTKRTIVQKTVTKKNKKKTNPVHSKVRLCNTEAFTVHELLPLLFKIFNHDALFCDVTDDYNFYIYISNFKDKLG